MKIRFIDDPSSKNVRWVCVLWVALHCGTVAAKDLFRFQASMPMQHFLMPVFNAEGEKLWQCSGDSVQYLQQSTFKVQKLCITFFKVEAAEAVDMVIRSDDAIVDLQAQRVCGQSLLTISHADYAIAGEQWVWESRVPQKNALLRVFVGKRANVLFYE